MPAVALKVMREWRLLPAPQPAGGAAVPASSLQATSTRLPQVPVLAEMTVSYPAVQVSMETEAEVAGV